jgi:hypothetical protein
VSAQVGPATTLSRFISSWRTGIPDGAKHADMLNQEPLGPALAFSAVDEFGEFMSIPPSVEARLDKLSEFGDAADAMQRLAFVFSQLVRDRGRLRAYIRGNYVDEERILEERVYFVMLFQAMIKSLHNASAKINDLFATSLGTSQRS